MMVEMNADVPAKGSAIYFVTGFHRSGTTIVSNAIADGLEASRITVADLAKHIPRLNDLMSKMRSSGDPVIEKGKLQEITRSTPAEYGWYLFAVSGQRWCSYQRKYRGRLSDLMAEVKARSGRERIVLKNPWDTGREALLLTDYPEANSIIIRRRLQDREASSRAYIQAGDLLDFADDREDRVQESWEYLEALMNSSPQFHFLASPSRLTRWLWTGISTWAGRVKVLTLIRSVKRLPLDRVAFVSYEELCENPAEGARWAGHILDPESFAKSFSSVAAPTSGPASSAGPAVVRALDRYWEKTWSEVRRRQVEAGLLPPT